MDSADSTYFYVPHMYMYMCVCACAYVYIHIFAIHIIKAKGSMNLGVSHGENK